MIYSRRPPLKAISFEKGSLKTFKRRSLWFWKSLLCVFFVILVSSAYAESDEELKTSLANLYKASFEKFISEPWREGQEAEMLKMLPSQKDLGLILGPNSEIVWKQREQLQTTLKNYGEAISHELKKAGDIHKIEVEKPTGSAINLLRAKLLIPPHFPAYSIRLVIVNNAVRLGPFVYLKDHWVFLPDLAEIIVSPLYVERHPEVSGFTKAPPESAPDWLQGTWKNEEGDAVKTIHFSTSKKFQGSILKGGKEQTKFKGDWLLDSAELRMVFLSDTQSSEPRLEFYTIKEISKVKLVLQGMDKTSTTYKKPQD